MRRLNTGFSDALAMVKKSRDIVNLNPGFQEQLRVWEQCQCDIFEKSSKGSRGTSNNRKEKPAYVAWKRGHGPKIRSDVDTGEEDEPKTAVALSPKTPVQEVGVQGMIDFIEAETG